MIYITLYLLKSCFRKVLIPLATMLLIDPAICDFCLIKMWTLKQYTIRLSCVNTSHRLSSSQYKYWRIIEMIIENITKKRK